MRFFFWCANRTSVARPRIRCLLCWLVGGAKTYGTCELCLMRSASRLLRYCCCTVAVVCSGSAVNRMVRLVSLLVCTAPAVIAATTAGSLRGGASEVRCFIIYAALVYSCTNNSRGIFSRRSFNYTKGDHCMRVKHRDTTDCASTQLHLVSVICAETKCDRGSAASAECDISLQMLALPCFGPTLSHFCPKLCGVPAGCQNRVPLSSLSLRRQRHRQTDSTLVSPGTSSPTICFVFFFARVVAKARPETAVSLGSQALLYVVHHKSVKRSAGSFRGGLRGPTTISGYAAARSKISHNLYLRV